MRSCRSRLYRDSVRGIIEKLREHSTLIMFQAMDIGSMSCTVLVRKLEGER